jgi:hypothetical protein
MGSVGGGLVNRGLTELSWSLLILGFIEVRGLAGPALIGESSKLFDLCLPDEILLLFLNAWGVFADMP